MSDDAFFAVAGSGCDQVTGDVVYRRPEYALRVRGVRAGLAFDGGLALAFVGRLDNSAELAQLLRVVRAAPDETAATAAAKLLLAGFRRWGAAFLDHAVGSFSGAVVDVQHHEVQAFRDLTAGGPAYVRAGRDFVVAGSDVVQVAKWNGGVLAASEMFVASYLQNMCLDPTQSPYQGVSSVLPGHIATADATHGRWRQARAATWHVRPVRRRHFEDYLDEFTIHFDAAVRRCFEDATKVAVSLSGGLDSTNVLASAVRVAPSGVGVAAYAIPFHTPQGDERARQIEVAAHCGVPITWVSVEGRGPVGRWSGQLFAGRPAPPLGGNWYFAESLCRQAALDGVAVLLDGEDADSLLTGNRTYLADLLITARLRSWLREAKSIRNREGTSLQQLLRYSLYKQIPNGVLAVTGRRPMAAPPSSLLAKPLAQQVKLARRLRQMPVARVWHPGRRFAQYIKLAADPHHLGMLLPELAVAARGSSLVTAHPFFDRQLMTFCMGLPWDVVCGDFTPKRLLRELARRRLPEAVHTAPTKARLDEYYDAAVYGHEHELVMKGLDLALTRSEWVDPQQVEKLIDAVRERKTSFMPSRVAMLMLWHEQLRQATSSAGLVRT